ncbi:hypothetical protein [Desulfosporosinus shakirovi]|uniref:hypothetical protein n=1 Tax=Desulfosporosinus shakirovi TaxID=2885154 RepID=UPI001E620AA2|nr:hypothetical protein [Desulfosporosinus sp. SRJS8]MCB8818085.1 hypothetical protein [Desulfosporosinus sp. SRJS8]
MKKILSLFLMMVFTLTLLTACSKTQNTLNTTGETPLSSSDASAPVQSTENATHEQKILNYIIVQRGRDGVRVVLQNDSSDKLKTFGHYGIVSDVENLLWIASRGGGGLDSETEEKKVTELPVIQESNKTTGINRDIWFEDTGGNKDVWIRLNYEPFTPDQGMNGWEHKDLIVYIDPNNHDNGFLGIQDAQDQNVWRIILLPSYGPWIEKEIDMLLRLTIAM